MLNLPVEYKDVVKDFTPIHELFIRRLITENSETTENKSFDIYIQLFKPKSTERNHLRRQINRILGHPQSREIVKQVQEQVNAELIKRTTITKEKLIHMFLRVHDKCMTDVPVTDLYGQTKLTPNPYYDPNDPSKGGKIIGIYQFKPQGAIKALENIKQLLGFDVKEVNINHKSTIIQQASEGLTQALPNAEDKSQLSNKELSEIKEAEFSLSELDDEIKEDEKQMLKARQKNVQTEEEDKKESLDARMGGTP